MKALVKKMITTERVTAGSLPKGRGKSIRAVQLLKLKNEARRIRQAHTAGEITAEEAAKQLSKLQSKQGHGLFRFHPHRRIPA